MSCQISTDTALVGHKQKKRRPEASEEDPLWEGPDSKAKKSKVHDEAVVEAACFVQCELCGKWRLLPSDAEVTISLLIAQYLG